MFGRAEDSGVFGSEFSPVLFTGSEGFPETTPGSGVLEGQWTWERTSSYEWDVPGPFYGGGCPSDGTEGVTCE